MPRVRAAERAGIASSESHYFSMRRAASDQVVAVTGASSGVGRAIARAFGAAGAKVGLIARGLEGLEACAREILRAGGEALVLPADVSDTAAVESAARALVDRWGRIDTWVNNAMVSVFSPAMEMAPDEFRRVMEVNYLGTVHGTLAALRHMLPLNHGVIPADWVGTCLSIDSVAERLLRVESGDPRIHRLLALRIAARRQQRQALHAAVARRQHAAIPCRTHAAALSSQTSAAHLPARV